MNVEEVRAIVHEHGRRMRWNLQLNDWTLSYTFDADDSLAKVALDNDRRIAAINIDPARHETSKAEVLVSLRHEMLHVFAGEFDVLCEMAGACLGEKEWAAIQRMRTFASERLVQGLERMFDHGLRINARALGTRDFDPPRKKVKRKKK